MSVRAPFHFTLNRHWARNRSFTVLLDVRSLPRARCLTLTLAPNGAGPGRFIGSRTPTYAALSLPARAILHATTFERVRSNSRVQVVSRARAGQASKTNRWAAIAAKFIDDSSLRSWVEEHSSPASQSGHLRCVRLTLRVSHAPIGSLRAKCPHCSASAGRQTRQLCRRLTPFRSAGHRKNTLHCIRPVGRKLARLPKQTFVRSRSVPKGLAASLLARANLHCVPVRRPKHPNGREASPGHVGAGTPAISREPGSSAEKARTHCGAASVSETSPPGCDPASAPHPDPLVAVRSDLRSVVEDSESLLALARLR